jgi:hypothetical protein
MPPVVKTSAYMAQARLMPAHCPEAPASDLFVAMISDLNALHIMKFVLRLSSSGHSKSLDLLAYEEF